MLCQCLFLYLCFVVGSYGQATSNLIPFIDKCVWNDEACLVASTKKAIPYFAKGLPEFGVEPMDPLEINTQVTYVEQNPKSQEVLFKIMFTKMNVSGPSKWNILKVKRYMKKNQLKIVAEGPLDVDGHFETSGLLYFNIIDEHGPFHVKCNLIKIAVLVDINKVVGPDGVRYWKIDKIKNPYEAERECTFNYMDLFNGDTLKSQVILDLINADWKEMMKKVAKPIIDEIIDEIIVHVQTFVSKVPADQLEKQ